MTPLENYSIYREKATVKLQALWRGYRIRAFQMRVEQFVTPTVHSEKIKCTVHKILYTLYHTCLYLACLPIDYPETIPCSMLRKLWIVRDANSLRLIRPENALIGQGKNKTIILAKMLLLDKASFGKESEVAFIWVKQQSVNEVHEGYAVHQTLFSAAFGRMRIVKPPDFLTHEIAIQERYTTSLHDVLNSKQLNGLAFGTNDILRSLKSLFVTFRLLQNEGYMHGDCKLANLLFDKTNTLWLSDFDVAMRFEKIKTSVDNKIYPLCDPCFINHCFTPFADRYIMLMNICMILIPQISQNRYLKVRNYLEHQAHVNPEKLLPIMLTEPQKKAWTAWVECVKQSYQFHKILQPFDTLSKERIIELLAKFEKTQPIIYNFNTIESLINDLENK